MKRLIAKEYYYRNPRPDDLPRQSSINRFIKMLINKTARQLGYSYEDFEYEYSFDTWKKSDNVSFSLSLKRRSMPITNEILHMLDVPNKYIDYCTNNMFVHINHNHGTISTYDHDKQLTKEMTEEQLLEECESLEKCNFGINEEDFEKPRNEYDDLLDAMNEDFKIIVNQLISELKDKFTKLIQNYENKLPYSSYICDDALLIDDGDDY